MDQLETQPVDSEYFGEIPKIDATEMTPGQKKNKLPTK